MSTNTLTDRYAWAVVRHLPEAQRDEIDRELHELVAEMVDARLGSPGGGRDAATVEREVLVELGDPSRLAARYIERPRSLVGPELFPEYLRVLKLLLAIVVPVVTALATLGAAIDDDAEVGSVVGAGANALFHSVVQVAFWVTVVYAFPDRWKQALPWSPDDLPDVPASASDDGFDTSDSVFGIVATILVATALVWQHVRPSLDDEAGEGIPFLDPDIWDWPAQVVLGLLVASLIVQLIVLVRRRWTYVSAAVSTVFDLGILGIVTWLSLDERLVNEQFLRALAERADWDSVPTVNPWIAIGIVAAIVVWGSFESFRGARRNARRRGGRAR